jgi:hypothetical protein
MNLRDVYGTAAEVPRAFAIHRGTSHAGDCPIFPVIFLKKIACVTKNATG